MVVLKVSAMMLAATLVAAIMMWGVAEVAGFIFQALAKQRKPAAV